MVAGGVGRCSALAARWQHSQIGFSHMRPRLCFSAWKCALATTMFTYDYVLYGGSFPCILMDLFES